MDGRCVGIGTYGDPITLMVPNATEIDECEVIYLPYLEKYAIAEDEWGDGLFFSSFFSFFLKDPHPSLRTNMCVILLTLSITASNETDLAISIWTGSSTFCGGEAQKRCEEALAPDTLQTIVRARGEGLVVDGEWIQELFWLREFSLRYVVVQGRAVWKSNLGTQFWSGC